MAYETKPFPACWVVVVGGGILEQAGRGNCDHRTLVPFDTPLTSFCGQITTFIKMNEPV